MRICSCWFTGNAFTIRSMVLAAPVVCSVPNTRCPVSAAVIAARLVKEFTDGRRNTDLFKRQEFAGNLAGHDAELALFLEDADAEPGQFTEGETKVRPAPLTHLLNVVFRGDTPHQLFGVLLLERRSFHFMQDAV